VVGGKWKALILWALQDGPVRFGALRREIPGISEKMLIQQLKELQCHGVVRRESFHEIPPRVEYSLTPLGVSLNEALDALGEWGTRHLAELAERTGRPPHPLHAERSPRSHAVQPG